MEPHEYIATLRKRWVLIVSLGLIGAAVAYTYASTLPILYRSTSSVFVASQRGETTSELVQGSTFTQAQVQSYAQLAPLPIVLDPVIDQLDLDTTAQALAQSVTADIRLNTVIIDITVSDRSAGQAAIIANAVTASLGEVAEDLSPRGPDNEAAITMTAVSSAKVAAGPYSPNTRFIVFSGLLVGLALAVAYALGREVLDTRVRGEKDFERVSDAPVLGSVASRKSNGDNPIIMRTAPYSPAAEDFRRLGTNLEFADVDNPVRSVVVTSALPGEGKTTSSINLALAMAERLQRVLLIDADLRKPSIADYCQIDGAVGLTSVLVGSAAVEEAIRPWAGGLIDVLPSGIVPANPSQMLGSDAMASLLDDLISRYDFIVLDSPPLLPVTDSLTLAKLTDGAIVVARYKSTRRHQLAQSLQSLETVSARILGLVLNGVKGGRADAYYGYRPEAPVDEIETEDADLDPFADESTKVVHVHEHEHDPARHAAIEPAPSAAEAPEAENPTLGSNEGEHASDEQARDEPAVAMSPEQAKERAMTSATHWRANSGPARTPRKTRNVGGASTARPSA